ncbi:MAG: hypothetical protein J7K21_02820, partial [Desulfurococcales archaeon]|nr:hypothetical protein [Desulfurococcales archaeon]
MKKIWEYYIPCNCLVDGIEIKEDKVFLDLYCRNDSRKTTIYIIDGVSHTIEGEPLELRSNVERRRELYVLKCYKGSGHRLWSRLVRAYVADMVCRGDYCVAAYVEPGNKLVIKMFDERGNTIETTSYNNVLDFNFAASRDLAVVSVQGIKKEKSSTLLVDILNGVFIKELTGFGGLAIACKDIVLVTGRRGNRVYVKGFASDGVEVIDDEGIASLIPYNPFYFQIPYTYMYRSNYVGVIGKFYLKIYNLKDYSIEYFLVKPPSTRGVYYIDEDLSTVTTLSIINGLPLVVTYDFYGKPLWHLPLIEGITRVLNSDRIVAAYDGVRSLETRVFSLGIDGV